jgi:hypothetical protein
MYQCAHSVKCIYKYYLYNGLEDCPHKDDENKTVINNMIAAEESMGIYSGFPDWVKTKLRYVRKHISFQTVCDGYTELAPQIIDDRNDTDETDCEEWPCNNIY